MRTYGLSEAQQDHVWLSLRAGESARFIARHHQAPLQHAQRYFRQTGGVRPTLRSRPASHLSAGEREEVSRGIAGGESRRIAGGWVERRRPSVGRSPTTADEPRTEPGQPMPRHSSGHAGRRCRCWRPGQCCERG